MDQERLTELLQIHRRDRRVLLHFILSGSLIKGVLMPPGAVTLDDVDLDQVCVDYVIKCAKMGGVLELSEAIRNYDVRTGFSLSNNTASTDAFFLATNPESSGSPPKRAPPPIPVSKLPPVSTSSQSHLTSASRMLNFDSFGSSEVKDLMVDDDIEEFHVDNDIVKDVSKSKTLWHGPLDVSDLRLKLPPLASGMSDDDLQGTAYEVLLACAGVEGALIVPSKDKRIGMRFRLMRKRGHVKGGTSCSLSQQSPGSDGLLELMRVQLEISEAVDFRTRQGLLKSLGGSAGKRLDTLLIPLELLCCISQAEFSDKKAYIMWQKRQLSVLDEGLIHHPGLGFVESGEKAQELKILLAKIEESEVGSPACGEVVRTKCLKSLRSTAFYDDSSGSICHWADGYPFNVKLYEKLLVSVFDILDEGKLIEEVDEILDFLKLTWNVLGVEKNTHYICYAWVLFRQFAITKDHGLLQHVVNQLVAVEQASSQEKLRLHDFHSDVNGKKFSFSQSFLLPIVEWADNLLRDYHLHFVEMSSLKNIILIVINIQKLLVGGPENAVQPSFSSDQDQIESWILSSIRNVFQRILVAIGESNSMQEHHLALLAKHTKKILEKDAAIFMPILSQNHPNATTMPASLLHNLYFECLKPFRDDAKLLTEDVLSVFPAAHDLELYIKTVITSCCVDEPSEIYLQKLTPFQVEHISGVLMMEWINSKFDWIVNCVKRAIQQEDWKQISLNDKHGISIIELYRIIQETVDQFFGLSVPMTLSVLSSLFGRIKDAFQLYVNLITAGLATKDDLVPPVLALTRCTKETRLKALVKKQIYHEFRPSDDAKHREINVPTMYPFARGKETGLNAFAKKEIYHERRSSGDAKSREIVVSTVPALCVQLNTLFFAKSQLDKLEDGILEKWATRFSREDFFTSKHVLYPNNEGKGAFNDIKGIIEAAMDSICVCTGTKIFWDMEEPFIKNLYVGDNGPRLGPLIGQLDKELGHVCDIIIEPLRDRLVASVLQASLDGFLRVILDGGPSRIFNLSDAKPLQEDFKALKEFFISDGDGLPRAVVEKQAEHVGRVIELHGCETRDLIDRLKRAGGGDGGEEQNDVAHTILRILCHRNDAEASRFVKKQFRIPRSHA